jgi:RNA polymerase sigma factor (sigma-70 family)
LFRLYHPHLGRLCLRWTRGHRADAEDLLAEAHLRAVRASGQSSSAPENPIAWLSAIIANLARDRLRARLRDAGPQDADSTALELVCDPHCASDTLCATRQLLSNTLAHVQSLGPAQRGALLARCNGEEYEVIAARLGISPGHARKLVQTARTELRARLSPDDLTLATQR